MVNLRLIGSKLTKVSAERNEDFDGKLEIKTNIKIDTLEKIKEPKDTVKIKYEFEVNYNDLGSISIKGNLFLSGDTKTIKELVKNHKDKKYNNNEFLAITNLIIQKASIKAFELEEELGLPVHIKLPSVAAKSN